MTGMWSRWARRHRITGLGFLVGAAVSIATAALLFTLGENKPASFALGLGLSFVATAVIQFVKAANYARLER